MFFNRKYQNAEDVVILLFKLLALDIKSAEIVVEFEKHPEYSSLLAISDVIAGFGIENIAYHVEPGLLQKVTCPFIAHNRRYNKFIVVRQIHASYP